MIITSLQSDAGILNALLDAAVDAIIVADAAGKMVRVNPAACRLFGHAADKMMGQNLCLLMPEEMGAQHDGFMRHHLETGENRIIGIGRDLQGLRADGTVFPLHLSIGRAEIDGAPVFVGIMHDLTRRKQAERALEQSQRMEAIGRLTGGVAHDFNNLLTVIIGNLELLEGSLATDDQRDMLQDALVAAELGASLTSQLLAVARRSLLTPVVLNVNDLVLRLEALLSRTISARTEQRIILAPDIWPVNVDHTQLHTALLNLAVNAQDAMPDGGKLVIETANVTIDDNYIAQEIDIRTGQYVRISVTDTGLGMSPEIKKYVFEPFFTTKPSGKGTGLGMAMVYGFIKQSGGHTTLYSEAGQGTTINLYLPSALSSQSVAEPCKDNAAAMPGGNGQIVLVVEDDPRVRRLSVARIEALGYTALSAGDAQEAMIFLTRGDPIDLVFTDLVMPGEMTGYDLARHIRSHCSGIRVLLTSGYAEELTHPKAVAESGFQILRKPYRQADLAVMLAQVLADPA